MQSSWCGGEFDHAVFGQPGQLQESVSARNGVGHDLQARQTEPLPFHEVEQLVRDAFTSATERHIEVGDGLQMFVVTKGGIEEKYFPLKRD